MTIALGILTPTEVIIAADTLESAGYAGAAKISGYKLLTRVIRGPQRSFCATGAGAAGHIDALNQELRNNFDIQPDAVKFERRIREKVRKFYFAHILPHYVLPDAQRPMADVIVGAHWNGVSPPMLWANHLSVVSYQKRYVAVGAGREHATMLLSHFLPRKSQTTRNVAMFMAAYVIYLVKGYVEGCGMGTHITVLSDGQAQILKASAIEELEKDFSEYVRLGDAAMLYMSGAGLAQGDAVIDGLNRYLKKTRRDINKFINESLEPVGGEAVIDVSRLSKARAAAKA